MKKMMATLLTAAVVMSGGLTANAQDKATNAEQIGTRTETPTLVEVLPKMTGPYEVGTANYDWVDKTRKEESTPDPDDYREIMVQVWYPIDSGEGKPMETYIPSPVQGIENLTRQFGMGEQFANLNQVATHTYKDAALSKRAAQYPVVLFSHGFGRARWEYQSITRELASQGYVVWSVEHTGFGLGTEFQDGRFVPFNPANAVPDFKQMDDKLNEYWVKDLQFVIRKMEMLNTVISYPNFKNRLDLDKIAAIGHSFGGAAAARALQVEPSIKAAINMDGSFVGLTAATGRMEKPFAFIKTEAHAKDLRGEYVLPPMPPGMDAKIFEEMYEEYAARYEQAVAGDAYDITIAGTTQNEHMNFTDHPLLKSYYLNGTPYVERDAAYHPNDFYRLINNVILSFLDKHLNGKTNTLFDLTIQ